MPVSITSPVRALARDTTDLYWGDASGTIQRVPLGGGIPVTLAQGMSIGPAKMVVDDRAVYYAGGLDVGSLYMIAK
jgi:hypothetical protein